MSRGILLDGRTSLTDASSVKPNDLIRRLSRLATRREWEITVTEGGHHTKVTLHGHRSVVPRHASDLKTGTLRAILRQLGVSAADLED